LERIFCILISNAKEKDPHINIGIALTPIYLKLNQKLC
jgi:hypothetical protein